MEAHAADACVTLGRLTLELCGRVCKIECVCAGHVLGVTSVVKQASNEACQGREQTTARKHLWPARRVSAL